MRIILRTMDLPGKSAALYRPRKSPIETGMSGGTPKAETRTLAGRVITPCSPLIGSERNMT